MTKGLSACTRLIRLFLFTVVLALAVVFFQVQESTGSCKAAFKAKKDGAEPAQVRAYALVAAPRFEIGGARGFYREKKPGHCLVRVTGPAWVEFSATPLYSLTGSKRDQLNVVYWVDLPEKESWSFRPGGPPLVVKVTRDTQRFNIYGGVAINEVSEQPAGEYREALQQLSSAINC